MRTYETASWTAGIDPARRKSPLLYAFARDAVRLSYDPRIGRPPSLPAPPDLPLPIPGRFTGAPAPVQVAAVIQPERTRGIAYRFVWDLVVAELRFLLPWGVAWVGTGHLSQLEEVDRYEDFVALARPWLDWSLACAEAWFAHLGQVSPSLEPDPLARAELTGRLRRQGRLLAPLRLTWDRVDLAHTCPSPACLLEDWDHASRVLRHASTAVHLASEFGVPVDQLRDQIRAATTAAGLAR